MCLSLYVRTIFIIGLLTLSNSCSSKNSNETTADAPACTSDCPTITSATAVSPGEQVTIHGENFIEGMEIIVGDQVIVPTVYSSTEASFALPDGVGVVYQIGISGNAEETVHTAASISADGIPVMTADSSLICEGTQFYDAEGVLSSGTRKCSRESASDCTCDGQQNFVVTGIYRSASTTGIESKIISGTTIAGVAGTYAEVPDCTGGWANRLCDNIHLQIGGHFTP